MERIALVALDIESDINFDGSSLGLSPKSIFRAVLSLDPTAEETPADKISSKFLPCSAAVAAPDDASVTIFWNSCCDKSGLNVLLNASSPQAPPTISSGANAPPTCCPIFPPTYEAAALRTICSMSPPVAAVTIALAKGAGTPIIVKPIVAIVGSGFLRTPSIVLPTVLTIFSKVVPIALAARPTKSLTGSTTLLLNHSHGSHLAIIDPAPNLNQQFHRLFESFRNARAVYLQDQQ